MFGRPDFADVSLSSTAPMRVTSWSFSRRWMSTLGPWGLLGPISGGCLAFLSTPWLWIGLLASVWCVWVAFLWPRCARLGINLAFGLTTLALAEGFWPRSRPVESRYIRLHSSQLPFFAPHELLGAIPRPDSQYRHLVTHAGEPICNVVYTINADGQRVVSPHDQSGPTLLLLGCSYTFGFGLADEETLECRFRACHPELRIANFAAGGYGTHQMLANLESGRVEQICEQTPRYILYQMIPDHVRRATGGTFQHWHSPRYRLVDGRAVRSGFQDDSRVGTWLRKIAWKSRLFSELIAPHLTTAADVDLGVQIVRQLAEETERRFPGCEFHLLLWTPAADPLSRPLVKRLRQAGLILHLLEEFAPEVNLQEPGYALPYDGHPTGRANDAIAKYICQQIPTARIRKTKSRQTRNDRFCESRARVTQGMSAIRRGPPYPTLSDAVAPHAGCLEMLGVILLEFSVAGIS